jgi:PAS domain S-box-containing protein
MVSMSRAKGQRALAVLRHRAEDVLRKTRRDVAELPTEDVQRLVHELQVHQVELEMQNEELRTRTSELEETRSLYQELYEFAPTGYLDLDSVGAIRQANLAAAVLLDVDRHVLVGRSFSEFVEAEDVLLFHEHLRDTARSVRSVCELRLSRPGGRPSYVLLVTSCDAAPTAGYLMALMDVTERQQAQEALHDLNEKLEERVEARTGELAKQNALLEREMAARAKGEEERRRLEARLRDAVRLESLGLLAGGIAHDFNNLLVGVLATADLLLHKQGLPDDVRDSVGLIKRAARGASDLTRQMLVYAGQSHVVLEAVDLHGAIGASLELIHVSLPDFAAIRTELANDVPPIEADRGQVQQVVTNLVMNAVEALHDGTGTVVVRTQVKELDAQALARFPHATGAQPGRFVVLSVTDTGRGMDARTLARVFDPFFTTKFTGRGLGLASVLGIVHGHRGAIRTRSDPGQGTTFEVAWPVSPAAAQTKAASVPATEWQGSGRALVVDDDEVVLAAVARQLEFLGFEVVPARSGIEGIRLVQEATSPFAVVMLDRSMPGLSGDQVLALLQELAPELPVVLMSGGSVEGMNLTGKRVTFLPKPMTVAELASAVRQVIEASE